MVCVTRSSSKHEGAETEDTIPPVRTRGRASTSRNATSTRRTRRSSAVEDSSNDAGANQGSEMSDHGSQASTGTESQRNSASPNPLTSTPSRRLRRKESETTGCAVQETPNAGKPPASPSRKRRGSSSSSQAAVTPSPARITRAMRKAGITTPKDVVELEVVPEEESTEEWVSKSTEKKGKERNSPVKSPAGGKKSASPSKESNDGNAVEEGMTLEDEPLETIASPDTKSALKAAEVASPERKHGTDRSSSSPSKKSPTKGSTPGATTCPARIEPEEAEKPTAPPSKKSPVKDVTPEGVLDAEAMDVEEQSCRSPIKKSPTKEVSPVKAAEVMELEADRDSSPARKSLSKRKSLKEAASPEPPKERNASSPVKGSPVKEVTPEALPEIVSVEAKCSSSGDESAFKEKSPKEIAAPEPVDLEAEFGIISPRRAVSDEVTPMKTVTGSVELEADPMRSPTKKSPVKEVSPKNVLYFEEMDSEEVQPIESPQKKSPKKVSSPQKNQPEELPTSSPGRKSPRKAEISAVLASEQPEELPTSSSGKKSPRKAEISAVLASEQPEELPTSSHGRKSPRKAEVSAVHASEQPKDEPVVASSRKSAKGDVVPDVAAVKKQNIEEDGSLSCGKKTKESAEDEGMEVSDHDDGGLTISKRNQSPSKLSESAAPEAAVPEESGKKSKGKKLKKATKKVMFIF
ncbi:hypothetical protein ANCCAN_14753 [Ancylostoma caninum]|uniref:Uncharacterized protein n=1 Tax=Ancylostoma caninum TaxID=29170 RepID=A0A368G8I2_ANCCA|nr:hypothetical protein ANCCAN_14753 [Ancylostoma caninum]